MKKNTGKRRRLIVLIAVILAGLLTGTAVFGYMYITGSNGSLGLPNIGDSGFSLNKRVSFLLIGADRRPGDTTFNADSIIVASVDPETKIVSLLSIPRDTRVTLPGSSPFVKINAIPMLRGIPELENEVTELTGIALDGYVLTNFDGFKDIIDTLGGVTIDVEKDMKYETGDKVDGFINLKKGEQRMTGSQALQYARFRHDATADIGRTARQQKVLKAVAKEVLQPSTLTKLTKLIPQIFKVVQTDLKLGDILNLSRVAASFDSSNIVSQTLPGYGLYLDGISYWEVNRDQVKKIAQNILMGITTDKVIDYTVMDLLDPSIKAHITVPGSSGDPNGTASPGHNNVNQTGGTGQNGQNSQKGTGDNEGRDSNNVSNTGNE